MTDEEQKAFAVLNGLIDAQRQQIANLIRLNGAVLKMVYEKGSISKTEYQKLLILTDLSESDLKGNV